MQKVEGWTLKLPIKNGHCPKILGRCPLLLSSPTSEIRGFDMGIPPPQMAQRLPLGFPSPQKGSQRNTHVGVSFMDLQPDIRGISRCDLGPRKVKKLRIGRALWRNSGGRIFFLGGGSCQKKTERSLTGNEGAMDKPPAVCGNLAPLGRKKLGSQFSRAKAFARRSSELGELCLFSLV